MQLDPETHQMTAIVLAGDRTKADSLNNHSQVGSKAMIDLDGTDNKDIEGADNRKFSFHDFFARKRAGNFRRWVSHPFTLSETPDAL